MICLEAAVLHLDQTQTQVLARHLALLTVGLLLDDARLVRPPAHAGAPAR